MEGGIFMEPNVHEFMEPTINKTNKWLDEIAEKLHVEDRHVAYRALRACIIELRNRLILEEAIHLGDQLPLLIRGIYYEGWKPSVNPVKERHRHEFLDAIQERFGPNMPADPETVAKAVFSVLAGNISAGEIEDVKAELPEEMKDLIA